MIPKLSDFNYNLPDHLIANAPTIPRDQCRLMVINRQNKSIDHQVFSDLLTNLTSNDVLVLNQSKVFPARLFGTKLTGGKVEILLLHPRPNLSWVAISRPGLRLATVIQFDHGLTAKVVEELDPGEICLDFNYRGEDFTKVLDLIGKTPLPPYIHTDAPESEIRSLYQTVYAKEVGSAAAPTAGMHFTQNLLNGLRQKGVDLETITLHVGLGTFQNLRPEQLASGKLHSEYYEIDVDTADRLNSAKSAGKRIIAVGTTTTRALESSAKTNGQITPGHFDTDIFIYPPYQFRFVDSLITNFHLPESSLLMLVSAFMASPNCPDNFTNFSESLLGLAYQQAVNLEYGFFSFGDAMLII